MSAVLFNLKRKLRLGDVEERCGLILKSGDVIECPNTHPDPKVGFRLPAADLVRHEGELAGSWHTHPENDANLSHEDYAGFLQWPDLEHYIVGRDVLGDIEVRSYVVHDGAVLRA